MKRASNSTTVVITGAANGLGKALAQEFYSHGYHLALIDIDQSALETVKQSFQDPHRVVSIHTVDVADEPAVVKVAERIALLHASIEILVNNAGISISQPFTDIQQSDFGRLMNVNFWGTVYCTRHLLPLIRKVADGKVANIISGFAFMGFPGKSAYAASKAAITGFTNALRTELNEYGIHVSLVMPPPMDTMLVKRGLHVDEKKRAAELSFLEQQAIPLDQVAQKIVSGILQGQYRIIVGWKTRFMSFLVQAFPSIVHTIIAHSRKRIDFV